ncbi:MAG: mechanosensitive ion channel family protein [Candidatus Woesearchaeota archaeon]
MDIKSILAAISSQVGKFIPLVRTLVVVVVLVALFSVILSLIRKGLLKKVKTKKQRSNVEIFTRVFKYMLIVIIVITAIFSYAGSWTGLGITAGLFSAALGWALQKPITGIAGWVMVVSRRPFEIGDRIVMGSVRGDVYDITLTHIYLREVGGIVAGEENSGRVIMIPNSLLFEQNITNYTLQDEYVLDQVVTTITYESDLDEAVKIAKKAAKKHTKDFIKETKREPYIRTFFQANGVGVHVRYFVPAERIQEFSSRITKEIFTSINQSRKVRISYPHAEVVFKNKKEKGGRGE